MNYQEAREIVQKSIEMAETLEKYERLITDLEDHMKFIIEFHQSGQLDLTVAMISIKNWRNACIDRLKK